MKMDHVYRDLFDLIGWKLKDEGKGDVTFGRIDRQCHPRRLDVIFVEMVELHSIFVELEEKLLHTIRQRCMQTYKIIYDIILWRK